MRATISLLPLSGLLSRVPFTVEGRAIERERVPVGAVPNRVLRVLRDGAHSTHDADARSRSATPTGRSAVALVNEELARQWLDGLESGWCSPAGGR